MPKSFSELNTIYLKHFLSLTCDKGVMLIAHMAKAAVKSGRHTFHVDIYESHIWPAPFRLKHSEDVWQNCFARYCVNLRKQGYFNRDMERARANFHFDFKNMQAATHDTTLMRVPVTSDMQVYEIRERFTNLDPHSTPIAFSKHTASLTSYVDICLDTEECEQAQAICQAWYPNLPDVEVMRTQFDTLLKPEPNAQYPLEAKQSFRHACDCCGLPTLVTGHNYEDCTLCDWQTSGFNEPDCLEEAQENFRLFGCMYAPEDTWFADYTSPAQMRNKHRLVDAYLALLHINKQHPDFQQRWQHLLRCENNLDHA